MALEGLPEDKKRKKPGKQRQKMLGYRDAKKPQSKQKLCGFLPWKLKEGHCLPWE
ncbi:MAG: hypothetical protein LBT59_26380 [Clostridiales bacterium]|nr:hypothetical protein [Clostridiales bacterium]